MTIKELAEAFVKQRVGRCHNAEVQIYTSSLKMYAHDPLRVLYKLHGHVIAEYGAYERIVTFNWCRHYTVTTANHMNKIIEAIGYDVHHIRVPRVSRAHDRDHDISTFDVKMRPL
jgi:hypothetical protein